MVCFSWHGKNDDIFYAFQLSGLGGNPIEAHIYEFQGVFNLPKRGQINFDFRPKINYFKKLLYSF